MIQELRIGNWLQMLDSSYFRVNENDFVFISKLPEKLYPKPIPLTEDILVKAALPKSAKVESGLLWYSRDCDDYFIAIKSVNEIGFLHKLQNLVSELTGEELTINL